MKSAYFAGGCFWCITPTFANTKGVINVTCGYCGGDEVNPTYEDVKKQKTSHRETIKIDYDEALIDYKTLLDIFINNVDVYDEGGQYIDRGHSYTLAIYYENDEEKNIINELIASFKKQVCISIEKLKVFYIAEEYHQNYYLKNPKEFEEELIKSGRKQ